MSEQADFHVRANKAKSEKAKALSGLSNREIYERGCDVIIEENENPLDVEILELHEAIAKVTDLTSSIKSRLKDKELPTKPNDFKDDETELKRNILPFELFKEICFFYIDDFELNQFKEIQKKHREIFRFVLINLSHHDMNFEDIDKLYAEYNSE